MHCSLPLGRAMHFLYMRGVKNWKTGKNFLPYLRKIFSLWEKKNGKKNEMKVRIQR